MERAPLIAACVEAACSVAIWVGVSAAGLVWERTMSWKMPAAWAAAVAAGRPARMKTAVRGPVRSVLMATVGVRALITGERLVVFGVREADVGVVESVGLVVGGDAVLGEVVALAVAVTRDAAERAGVGE